MPRPDPTEEQRIAIESDLRSTAALARTAEREGNRTTALIAATWAGAGALEAADLGIMTPNPFSDSREPELASAWREGRAKGREARAIPSRSSLEHGKTGHPPHHRQAGMTHAAHSHPED